MYYTNEYKDEDGRSYAITQSPKKWSSEMEKTIEPVFGQSRNTENDLPGMPLDGM
jgi:hypothetical protein